MTFPSHDLALEVARSLLDQRLIACANVLGAGTSLYRWEGELCEEAETYLLAKGLRQNEAAVVKAVRVLHPHQVPCVVVLPIEGGNPEFLTWVRTESR